LLNRLADTDEFLESDALEAVAEAPFFAGSIDLEKAVELGLITDMD
jgi:hypothetical protein